MIIVSMHNAYGTVVPFSWKKGLKNDARNNLIGENSVA